MTKYLNAFLTTASNIVNQYTGLEIGNKWGHESYNIDKWQDLFKNMNSPAFKYINTSELSQEDEKYIFDLLHTTNYSKDHDTFKTLERKILERFGKLPKQEFTNILNSNITPKATELLPILKPTEEVTTSLNSNITTNANKLIPTYPVARLHDKIDLNPSTKTIKVNPYGVKVKSTLPQGVSKAFIPTVPDSSIVENVKKQELISTNNFKQVAIVPKTDFKLYPKTLSDEYNLNPIGTELMKTNPNPTVPSSTLVSTNFNQVAIVPETKLNILQDAQTNDYSSTPIVQTTSTTPDLQPLQPFPSSVSTDPSFVQTHSSIVPTDLPTDLPTNLSIVQTGTNVKETENVISTYLKYLSSLSVFDIVPMPMRQTIYTYFNTLGTSIEQWTSKETASYYYSVINKIIEHPNLTVFGIASLIISAIKIYRYVKGTKPKSKSKSKSKPKSKSKSKSKSKQPETKKKRMPKPKLDLKIIIHTKKTKQMKQTKLTKTTKPSSPVAKRRKTQKIVKT